MVLRVARPTNNLAAITRMYTDGMSFELLGAFENHRGFDGVILGRRDAAYHLEFTSQRGHSAAAPPDPDQLLVFYIPDRAEWSEACRRLDAAGFRRVASANPFWDDGGRTFEDVDGYRVVLQRAAWTPS